jgi:DNA mismatch endonuclease (patch repair protein)
MGDSGARTPPPSSPAARATMIANRRRDTAPEIALRRELHRRGLRFRVDHLAVPGTRCRVDVAFIRARVAVFIDGCFWHRCPEHGVLPKANAEWWADKLEANVARDRRNDGDLRAADWQVIRVWEHEAVGAAADRITVLVGPKSDGAETGRSSDT